MQLKETALQGLDFSDNYGSTFFYQRQPIFCVEP